MHDYEMRIFQAKVKKKVDKSMKIKYDDKNIVQLR